MNLENIMKSEINVSSEQEEKQKESRWKKLKNKAYMTLAGATALTISVLGGPAPIKADQITPATQPGVVRPITLEQEKNQVPEFLRPPAIMGSIYGEASYIDGDAFERSENPVFINAMIGYNLLERNINDGVLLVPNFRFHVKNNRSGYNWDKHLDVSVGAAYQINGFIFGADVGHRTAFDQPAEDGEFARLWGGYWNKIEVDAFNDSSEFPFRPYAIPYAEFEASTLSENLIFDGRLEAGLDAFESEGFKAGPFVAAKLNLDTEDEPWNNYFDASAGLKLTKGPFALYLQAANRSSLNDDGADGMYYSATIGFWVPIDFGGGKIQKE